MTHQNHQTNGASLEDCHTNFFALVSHFYIDERSRTYFSFEIVMISVTIELIAQSCKGFCVCLYIPK